MYLKTTKTIIFLTLPITTTISSLAETTRSANKSKGGAGGGYGGDYFGPGGGFGIPGFADPGIYGGGYGYGYGSRSGGHGNSGTMRPSIVCKEKGPCYNKKLICPAKCFYSFSRSGKSYGGGGCTMDWKKICIAYC